MADHREVLIGDCRDVLPGLPAGHFHTCVTSPPYFGLRDYGVDGQIGLEPTPAEYVAEMVKVFRLVWRVLRDDGTVWLNLGDSYAGSWGAQGRNETPATLSRNQIANHPKKASHTGSIRQAGLKPKDLIGIPWRVAFALQADGWYLRQDIIWCLSGGAWLYARTQKGVGPAMLKDLVRLDPDTVELWTGERWTHVTAWTKREGRSNALEIVLRSGERIGCTGEHLWPTQRGNVRADDLRKGDQINAAKLPTSDKSAEWLIPDAFWFAGLYLAEGSKSGETIQISGHVRETDRWERIQALASYYGASARLYQDGNKQAIHIDRAHALNAVLDTLIGGHTAKDKHLTPAAWGYRNWALTLIAEGYLEGDGHYDGTRIRLGFTRNYSLERDIRCLAARLGATITLKPTFSTNQTGRFPSFRGEWRWNRSGHHNERDRGEVMEIRRSRARKFWDVSIADASSLFALASGVLTHNSKPNPMPESVTDRCTKAHEYIFLLTKKPRYYYDAKAIAEPLAFAAHAPGNKSSGRLGYNGKTDNAVHQSDRIWGASGLRNRRSVWTVTTQPFSQAHFATFPPKLIEPCILAGCPAQCCGECGAPYERQTESTTTFQSGSGRAGRTAEEVNSTGKWAGKQYGANLKLGPTVSTKTLGFTPTCDCAAPAIPGRVLDPFGGAGTTGLVADRLQLRSTMIELNPAYADMAAERIEDDAPLLGLMDPPKPAPTTGQLDLGDAGGGMSE